MKCPYCNEKLGFASSLTVLSPFNIPCPHCEKRFTVGTLGSVIVILGGAGCAFLGYKTGYAVMTGKNEVMSLPIWQIVTLIAVSLIVATIVVWFFDSPKAKE